eukprot:TRINITY_DN10473_c0_g1_i10.p1 TRINITY_DN10473_c0_g1~~TRINITY_DN10473_c0_g1_i10.p1  ORF type:complete len:178 (-),score=41.28 TRINITY_DN10473_c0_g1_i10:106-639(-)
MKEWGKIDIVCNNAGIAHPDEDLFSDGDIWKMIVSVNLSAVIEGTKLALKYMKESGGGVVINTASLAAYFSTTAPVYAATKAGVANFTRSIKPLAADCGVKVSAVCPGFIKTNMGIQVPLTVVKMHQGDFIDMSVIVEVFEELAVDRRGVGGSIVRVTKQRGIEYEGGTQFVAKSFL